MNNKVISYLLSGSVLLFYGLKDLDNFCWYYEGIALGLGITTLILAVIEYSKDNEEKKG